MVQGGQRLSLAGEAREPIRISGEEIRQDLDGDIAVERRVLRAVDLAHPPGAELGNDFVRTDVGMRRKGHWNAAILRQSRTGSVWRSMDLDLRLDRHPGPEQMLRILPVVERNLHGN